MLEQTGRGDRVRGQLGDVVTVRLPTSGAAVWTGGPASQVPEVDAALSAPVGGDGFAEKLRSRRAPAATTGPHCCPHRVGAPPAGRVPHRLPGVRLGLAHQRAGASPPGAHRGRRDRSRRAPRSRRASAGHRRSGAGRAQRRRPRAPAPPVSPGPRPRVEDALVEGLGVEYVEQLDAAADAGRPRAALAPARLPVPGAQRRGRRSTRDVAFSDAGGRGTLDIYRPAAARRRQRAGAAAGPRRRLGHRAARTSRASR